MRRFSAALLLAFVLLGSNASLYAAERDVQRPPRESRIIKVIREIAKIFRPTVLDDINGPPKP